MRTASNIHSSAPSARIRSGSDAMVHRLERDAAIACGGLTLAALVVRPGAAAGVIAGSLLVTFSYLAIKGLADVLTASRDRGTVGADRPLASIRRAAGTRRRLWALVKFFTRYVMLFLGAYLLAVRFRLDPIAMLAGASIFVIAAAAEAIRALRAFRRPPAGDPVR